MTKAILVTSADYMSIPAAQQLLKADMLACIVVPQKHQSRLITAYMQAGFDKDIMHTVNKAGMVDSFSRLIQQYNADVVFVITFPWQIPSDVLNLPKYGFINFHPGLMPEYKGADPIFWQIRNREQYGGFTIHRMTEIVDAGPVIMEHKIPVIPGETYGIHHVRLGVALAEIMLPVVEKILAGNTTPQTAPGSPQYFKRPTKDQITIQWESQTAEEIEALVNAGNPKYNGAFSSIRNMELTILEVSFADFSNPPPGIAPGTIVYADALYGLVVACTGGGFLRLHTFGMPEGYLSGSKLFAMGFKVGEHFR